MQASVHSFDAQTGDGSVLLDDGRRVPFDAGVFARSGLRLLRSGQRVTIELAGDTGADGAGTLRVSRLGIVGVPAS